MENMSPSLADIAAVTKDNEGFGGAWTWIIALFIIAGMFNGGGLFGGNSASTATAQDIQRAVDINSIQQGQAEIRADVQRSIYETNEAVASAAYNNLGEIRDVQSAVAVGNANLVNQIQAGFANMQNCCCDMKSAVMENRYLAAQNAAEINANTTAQAQKILDAISGNRIADMQNQINALQLQNAVSGVVRYPMASTYSAGMNPYCGVGA